jgi:hypothetical protein
MKTRRVVSTVAAILAALSLGSSTTRSARVLGTPSNLGNGTVASYAEFDKSGAPKAIGVVFSAGALDALPAAPSDGHRCFDANNDGVIDLATECSGWHERVLPAPSEASRRPDVPFKWALLNWNPRGHIPPGVFDTPHFDVHFYIEPIENIFAIQRGTCGPEMVRCDQFALARKPVPRNYVPPNFQDLGLVAPAMGNHLVDPTDHVFHGEKFKRHWIYGAYDGPGHLLRGDGRPRLHVVEARRVLPDPVARRRRAGRVLPDAVVHPLHAWEGRVHRLHGGLRASQGEPTRTGSGRRERQAVA